MTSVETVRDWLDQGRLIHPISRVPSIVSLSDALATMSGAATHSSDTRSAELAEEIGYYDHYVFVLVDALGLNLQHRFPEGGFFSRYFRRQLVSIFPSTTAAALTSIASGAEPAQHGITGWWTYFREISRTIAPILFRERDTGIPADELGLTMSDLIPVGSRLPLLFRETRSFVDKSIAHSEYSEWSRSGTGVTPFRSVPSAMRKLARHVHKLRSASYSYMYISQVDTLSHTHGYDSHETAEAIARIDKQLMWLRQSLPNSARIVVTADHGQVNIGKEAWFAVHEHDRLMSYLSVPPSGEPTAPCFHVIPGREADFRNYFENSPFSRYFTLITSAEADELGIYGSAPLSEAMKLHLGTFIGIAAEPAAIEYVAAGRQPKGHVGQHGGMRPGEMHVPLFLA